MSELAGEFEADPGMQHTEVINESVRALIASVTVMPGSTALVSVLGKLGALIGSPPPTVAIRMVPQEGLSILPQPIDTHMFFKNQKTRYTFGYTRAPSAALGSMEVQAGRPNAWRHGAKHRARKIVQGLVVHRRPESMAEHVRRMP